MFGRVRHSDLGDLACSIARPVALLGDRWTFMVLRDAFSGVRRFDQFQSRLGISRPLLADRLARLVDAGVLELRPYADARRTRHEYRLTEKGMDLYPVLAGLRAFADKHMSPEGPVILSEHKNCGGSVEVHLTCSECGAEVGARDVVARPGPGAAPAAAAG
jgi:DNA-binding HxlR family transcriptional regulator